MKANRKFIEEEEAVSPVIAVILMVAITVVLAATVFVLVNDLGKNVGSTGPSLGMVSDSAQSSTSKWTVKLSSATKLADLTDYRFVITTPSSGTLVAVADNNTFTSASGEYFDLSDGNADRETGLTAQPGKTTEKFRILWSDIDGNNKFSVGDTVEIGYDTTDNDATWSGMYDNTFPNGEYTLEILHIPSGSSAGSLPRTF